MPKGFSHLPTVAHVEALPEGVARLHLQGGQAVEVPAGYPSFFSPDEYAPSLLHLIPTKAPVSGPCFVVPDALRLPVMAALGYALTAKEGATCDPA